MTEEHIVEIWTLFKEYIDKKQADVIAEGYIDLLADYGIPDETLKDCLGADAGLDEAINYYLDLDSDEDEDWED
jgi:hypothetical protein